METKQVQALKNLESKITQDGSSGAEIKSRIAVVKQLFYKTKHLQAGRRNNFTSAKQLYKISIWNVALHGAEALVIAQMEERKP